MNKHLKLVREFRDACSLPQAEHGSNSKLSDMNMIMCQALLMVAGSEVFKAIKTGDMVEILLRTAGFGTFCIRCDCITWGGCYRPAGVMAA